MDDKPKPRWFQIHLSTLYLLTIMIAVMMGLYIPVLGEQYLQLNTFYKSVLIGGPIMILAFTAIVFEWDIRRGKNRKQ